MAKKKQIKKKVVKKKSVKKPCRSPSGKCKDSKVKKLMGLRSKGNKTKKKKR